MAKSIMEMPPTLICTICLDPPKDYENCQECSLCFCKSCIDTCYQTNAIDGYYSCPNCRKSVQRNNFKKLPCVQNLLDLISDRQKELEHSKMNECSQHAKQQLSVYCSTCSKAICAQCITSLFNGEHVNHVYSQIDDSAQKRLLKTFDEHEAVVQLDLVQMNKYIQNKKDLGARILASKELYLQELNEFQKNIQTGIEFEATTLVKNLKDEANILIENFNDFDLKRSKLKETIQSSNVIQLFEQEKELTKQILQRIDLSIEDKINLSNNFINNPLEVAWETSEFIIKEFSAKQKSHKYSISSQPVQLNYNQHWTIIIYPNGIDHDSGIHLSAMVQLKKGISQLIKYDLIIELIHHRHDDNQHNHFLKTEISVKEGQIEGFYEFYKVNELLEHGFIHSHRDSIKFRFKLRPKSILEERKLLQWQIEYYNNKQQKANEEMKRNHNEQIKQMNKTQDELNCLRSDHQTANQMIDILKDRIKKLQRDNSEYKRKRSSSNCYSTNESINQEDRQSDSLNKRTAVFSHEKRLRK